MDQLWEATFNILNNFDTLIPIVLLIGFVIYIFSEISRRGHERTLLDDLEKLEEKVKRARKAKEQSNISMLKALEKERLDFINQVGISLQAREDDGSVILNWEVLRDKGRSDLSVSIYRSKDQGFQTYSQADEKGKLIVPTDQLAGEFKDTATRVKGGDFYYTGFVFCDGYPSANTTTFIRVLSNLQRYKHRKKAENHRMKIDIENEKVKEEYMAQMTRTDTQFMEYTEISLEREEMEERTGRKLNRSINRHLIKDEARAKLGNKYGKANSHLSQLYYLATTKAKSKRASEEAVSEIFSKIRSDCTFANVEERASAYEVVIEGAREQDFINDFNIDPLSILVNIDPDAFMVLSGDISDEEYQDVD